MLSEKAKDWLIRQDTHHICKRCSGEGKVNDLFDIPLKSATVCNYCKGSGIRKTITAKQLQIDSSISPIMYPIKKGKHYGTLKAI